MTLQRRVFLVLSLAACGGPDEVGAPGEVHVRQRLTPSAAADTPPAPDRSPTVTRAWDGPALVTEGTLKEGALTLDPEGNALMAEGGQARLTLPLEPGDSFDRAVVVARCSGGHVSLGVVRAGRRTWGPAVAAPKRRRGAITLELLPGLEGGDEVAIGFKGTSEPPVIRSVTLLRHPPIAHYPELGAAERVFLGPGRDGRVAVGLDVGRSVEVQLDARTGARLAVAAGALRAVPAPRALSVAFVGAGGEERRGARLELEPGAWSEAALELPAGRSVARITPIGEEGAACALAVLELERPTERPPTVLLVTTDTHRGDHLGVARRPAGARTPFLDSLADRGVHFLDCLAAGNSTNPTHVTMMTGVPIRDHAVLGNDQAMSPDVLTLSEHFGAAGYATYAALSTAHLEWCGLPRGFDRESAPTTGQRNSKDTIAVLEGWLEESSDRPVFAWLHVFDAHSPYDPPAEYVAQALEGERFVRGQDTWEEWSRRSDPDWVRALYAGEVGYMDARLGELFDRRPRLEAGIVAVVGDHGENMLHAREPDWSFRHTGLSIATLHVPLILRWPDGPRGLRVERPVHQLDVGRTLLDLAGLGHIEFPGDSLALLAETLEAGPERRFSLAGNGWCASVREGRWLLVHGLFGLVRQEGRRVISHQVELYDVEADPGCQHDLAAEEQERARALRTALVEWLSRANVTRVAPGKGKVDPTVAEHLAAMGYASSDELPEGTNPWIDPDCACPDCLALPLVR